MTKHIKSYGKDSYLQDLIRIFALTINKIRIVYEEKYLSWHFYEVLVDFPLPFNVISYFVIDIKASVL